MGSKGGSAPTESTVTQTNLPEYAEPFYRDLLARVGYESAVPYETFTGQRLQYFTPAEQEAMERFKQLGVAGTPQELETAGGIAAQIGEGSPYAETMLETTRRAQEMPAYANQFQQGNVVSQYNPEAATTQNLQPFMSPYQQLVVDREKEEAIRQSQIMGQNIGLQAAGSGSLGGYREAIMQAERQRNLEDQLGDIQAAGSQRAFEMARSGFDAYEQARQQAAQLGLSAEQQEQAGRIAEEQANRAAAQLNLGQAQTAAQLGQSAYGQLLSGGAQQLQAAGMLGDYAAQQQAQEMERLRAMQAAGQIERELLQRGLDVGYADFLRQQAFPKEQLAFYSSMLQGVPVAPGTVSQAYGVTPSMTQQLLGSGIAGVGLYNALSG